MSKKPERGLGDGAAGDINDPDAPADETVEADEPKKEKKDA